MNRPSRLLRVTPLELASLAVLLANVSVLDLQSVASAIGPLHGCAYLIVIIATAREAGPDRTATALSAVPGIGGMLACGGSPRGTRGRPDRPAAGGRGPNLVWAVEGKHLRRPHRCVLRPVQSR
jgi:hypothetical protein